jgi:hypothetical protein
MESSALGLSAKHGLTLGAIATIILKVIKIISFFTG